MPFIVQQDSPNCGAFAVAYYHWLSSHREPPEQEQIDEVQAITDAVLFGPDAPVSGLGDYCDPVKMILYLKNVLGVEEPNIKFFSGGRQNHVDGLLMMMLNSNEGRESEANQITAWIRSGLVQRSPVPNQWTGYLISLAYASASGVRNQEQQCASNIHYALVQGPQNNAMVINSWDGYSRPGTKYVQGTELLKTGRYAEDATSHALNRLQFLNAGILITN